MRSRDVRVTEAMASRYRAASRLPAASIFTLRPLVGPGFRRVADDDQRDRACCACPVADGAAHQLRVVGLTSVVPMLGDVIFECREICLQNTLKA